MLWSLKEDLVYRITRLCVDRLASCILICRHGIQASASSCKNRNYVRLNMQAGGDGIVDMSRRHRRLSVGQSKYGLFEIEPIRSTFLESLFEDPPSCLLYHREIALAPESDIDLWLAIRGQSTAGPVALKRQRLLNFQEFLIMKGGPPNWVESILRHVSWSTQGATGGSLCRKRLLMHAKYPYYLGYFLSKRRRSPSDSDEYLEVKDWNETMDQSLLSEYDFVDSIWTRNRLGGSAMTMELGDLPASGEIIEGSAKSGTRTTDNANIKYQGSNPNKWKWVAYRLQARHHIHVRPSFLAKRWTALVKRTQLDELSKRTVAMEALSESWSLITLPEICRMEDDELNATISPLVSNDCMDRVGRLTNLVSVQEELIFDWLPMKTVANGLSELTELQLTELDEDKLSGRELHNLRARLVFALRHPHFRMMTASTSSRKRAEMDESTLPLLALATRKAAYLTTRMEPTYQRQVPAKFRIVRNVADPSSSVDSSSLALPKIRLFRSSPFDFWCLVRQEANKLGLWINVAQIKARLTQASFNSSDKAEASSFNEDDLYAINEKDRSEFISGSPEGPKRKRKQLYVVEKLRAPRLFKTMQVNEKPQQSRQWVSHTFESENEPCKQDDVIRKSK